MKNPINKKPLTCKLLIFMHVLLGIGAVFGGLVLVIDPSGGLIKMPSHSATICTKVLSGEIN